MEGRKSISTLPWLRGRFKGSTETKIPWTDRELKIDVQIHGYELRDASLIWDPM